MRLALGICLPQGAIVQQTEQLDTEATVAPIPKESSNKLASSLTSNMR